MIGVALAKQELRKKVLSLLKREITPEQRTAWSAAIAARVIDFLHTHPLYGPSLKEPCGQHPPWAVLLYLNMFYEVQTKELLEFCWQRRIATFVPLMLTAQQCGAPGEMVFVHLQSQEDLNLNFQEQGKLRIRELSQDERNAIMAAHADHSLRSKCRAFLEPEDVAKFSVPPVVIVPAAGFDARRNRLGKGGGFYDGYFNAVWKAQGASGSRCSLVGVAFDEMIVEDVPTELHDRPVDVVITPTRTI